MSNRGRLLCNVLGPIFDGDSLIINGYCVVFVVSRNCNIVAVDGQLIIPRE